MGTNAKISSDALYVIDGSGYIFRAYFAIPSLKSASGIPTNAVYGFTAMLMKLLKEHRPQHLAIAFDAGKATFRHQIYAEYKAHRPEPPKDLVPQFEWIRRVVDAFCIPCFRQEGYEADDLIGTLTRKAREAGRQVVIVTGDKDFMQLVSEDVFLLDELRATKTGTEELIDIEGVIKKFGVPPSKVVDVLSMAGDASDNVPGVRGIGEKTAAELIKEYGSLDSILNAAPLIKQKSRRDKLLDGADFARLSRQLVTINSHVEMDVSMSDLTFKQPDISRLFEIFRELGFKRLLVDPYFGSAGTAANVIENERNENKKVEEKTSGYSAITTEKQLDDLVAALSKVSVIALGAQTDGLDPMQCNLVGISLAYAVGKAVYIPLQHDVMVVQTQLDRTTVIRLLDPILTDSHKIIVAQNAKFDQKVLVRFGFPLFHIGGDPMLASYLLESDTAKHNLEELSLTYLNHEAVNLDDIRGKGKKQLPFSSLDLENATRYSAERVDLVWRLHEKLAPQLEAAGLTKLYHKLELPLEQILSDIERFGVKVNVALLKQMGAEFENELKSLEQKAWAAAGHEFNLASPKQVGEVLFEKLNLPMVKKTKTGSSTDVVVLEKLAEHHALPRLILEHRSLSKLKGTYIDSLPLLVNPITGRIHTSFNQAVAATGRLSSSDPNLQNIPNRSKEGRRIREAFIAEPSHLLIALDYSQIELRILASLSQDPVMIDAFLNGQDVHARTASEVFSVALVDVSREQRNFAKTINFGLMYGMGVHRLSQTLNISRAEASVYLDTYYRRYEGIYSWQKTMLKIARETQEVRTLFGRRRKLPELNSKNHMLVQRAERIAINTPIQGTAADIIKFAMIKVSAELKEHLPQARMILQVHDELVIEAPSNQAQAAEQLVKKIMSEAAHLLVPIVVDSKIGENWAMAH